MKKLIFLLITIFVSSLTFCSCGGGGGDGGTSTGTMALFATDAPTPDLSGFQQVDVPVNSVSLLNTGTSAACDLSTSQTALNLSDLSDTIQLLSISTCPSTQYNRIHIVFGDSVTLMQNNTTQTCTFTSFKDENNKVDTLDCNSATRTCSIDINGAVNVLASQPGKLALDFTLKDFEVTNFPDQGCTATMKVSPLNASGIEGKEKNEGYKEAITGFISNINLGGKTFIIMKNGSSFTVDYSGVTTQGIDQLLQFALDNNLKVQVKSSSIDLSINSIKASAVYIKVEGTIKPGTLNTTNMTFTLVFDSGEITVDYSTVEVEGTLGDNLAVEAKLVAFDGAKYKAIEVEQEIVETGD